MMSDGRGRGVRPKTDAFIACFGAGQQSREREGGKGEEQTSNLRGTEEFLRLGHPLPNQVIVANGNTLSGDLDGMRDKHWGNGSISPQCTKGVFIAERATFMRGR